MVFSLFSKKSQPEPAKPAPRRAPPKPPAVARPVAESAPPAAPAPAAQELIDLDFTHTDLGGIEVEEHAGFGEAAGDASVHHEIEEAAILFANGQDEAARTTLEAAVDRHGQGAAADALWAMLFDLYQMLGQQDTFEQRALDYSLRFEKSPPTWVEPDRQVLSPTLATGGAAFVTFAGVLDGQDEKTLAQFEKIVAANPAARVELGKLQDITPAGAQALLPILVAARKKRCELVIGSCEKLIELLQGRIEVGRREDEAFWRLLLELFLHCADQETFEEWAVNFAVTFEVSPPSWENRPTPKKAQAPLAAETASADEDAFRMSGEMFSAGSDAFRQLIDYAGGRQQILIDCAHLKRMDFVSAGLFLNTLTNLQVTGSSVTIRHPNHLLFALFGVLGINQVAHIERRKF